MSALSTLPEVVRILELAKRLEEISVPSAAKLLSTTPKWVRRNLPIIHHGPRGQRVRLADIEAFQAKRTVWPKNNETL